jgi:voltage-gated potassium channel
VIKKAEEHGHLVLQGDAASDETLIEAGVERAKGIVCALPDDTANTFIALSAKGLNEAIIIVSRAANPGSEGKMRRAGAHMVISPYVICGRRMATAVTHPLVTEFLDVVMHSPGYDLRMEQIIISKNSPFIGVTLKDANIKQTSGAMILAVNQDGKLMTNPDPELQFHIGDELIALGAAEQLKILAGLAGIEQQK